MALICNLSEIGIFWERKRKKNKDLRRLFFRQDHHEAATLIGFGKCIDPSMMIFHNFLADGQTNARCIVISSRMEALENMKDLFGMLRIEADTIIPYLNLIKFFILIKIGIRSFFVF